MKECRNVLPALFVISSGAKNLFLLSAYHSRYLGRLLGMTIQHDLSKAYDVMTWNFSDLRTLFM